jgi:hypothetical protein
VPLSGAKLVLGRACPPCATRLSLDENLDSGGEDLALCHGSSKLRAIRIWAAKCQMSDFAPDFVPIPRLSEHEITSEELERIVGKTGELKFLRVLRSTQLRSAASMSIEPACWSRHESEGENL